MSSAWEKGKAQMVLGISQIPAEWDNWEGTLKAMNRAFEIYYLGIVKLLVCLDHGRDDPF